ncbi:uncharacterized protein METZ01_LOCUS389778 [marine metagenome]|jgi:hypothetical protein|uniref:Uncharacterized protein n=1 Tax=marine metagenome TaxID=408172 RepID=A0A382URP2_9ZZZZ
MAISDILIKITRNTGTTQVQPNWEKFYREENYLKHKAKQLENLIGRCATWHIRKSADKNYRNDFQYSVWDHQ